MTLSEVEAPEWCEKAAANGSAVAMDRLGSLYRYGFHAAKDHVKAREWYEKVVATDDEVLRKSAERALRELSIR